MKYFPKITGERIYLSPIDTDDAELYTKWINDPAVSDMLGVSNMVYTKKKEISTLEKMAEDGYNFAIIRKEDDALLGNCSLFDIHNTNRRAMCGLFIGEAENRGKGYGTEALKLLLDYGFNTLNLNNIALQVFAFNKNAIACYEKLGFKTIGARRQSYFYMGEYHDEIYMDYLAEDFNPVRLQVES